MFVYNPTDWIYPNISCRSETEYLFTPAKVNSGHLEVTLILSILGWQQAVMSLTHGLWQRDLDAVDLQTSLVVVWVHRR